MTMRRIVRDRRLTPEEAAKYGKIRKQVAGELPELIARHHERTAALDQLDALLQQLKSARAVGSELGRSDASDRDGPVGAVEA